MRETVTAAIDLSAHAISLPMQQRLLALADVPKAAWSSLSDRALETNAFYHPDWACAVVQNAGGYAGAKALLGWDHQDHGRLIACLPVVSAWQALKLPIPMLVSWKPYAPLNTPLIDNECPEHAIEALLDSAAASGARALWLPLLCTGGAVFDTLQKVLTRRGIAPRTVNSYQRARLDARGDAEQMLKQALGAKKLKDLRRQRHRLEDSGAVSFRIVETPAEVEAAVEVFLALEATGWKGKRGTAMVQHAGDAAFIRSAMSRLAARGLGSVALLMRGDQPLAVGLVLREGGSAHFFKIAFDEGEAKNSPGVQLTLELTRAWCADPAVTDVDSNADADHPMIDKIWDGRMTLVDQLIPLRANDPFITPIEQLIRGRQRAREQARRIVHTIRTIRERRP